MKPPKLTDAQRLRVDLVEGLDARGVLTVGDLVDAIVDHGVPAESLADWKAPVARRDWQRFVTLRGEGLRLTELARELAALRCSVESAAVADKARARLVSAYRLYFGDREGGAA